MQGMTKDARRTHMGGWRTTEKTHPGIIIIIMMMTVTKMTDY
jgi:hypothetical protein